MSVADPWPPTCDKRATTRFTADLDMCGAQDTVVMQVARTQRRVLLSADTDFGEMLARSNDDQPSVVLFRGHEVEPATMAVMLLANLDQIDELQTAGRSW